MDLEFDRGVGVGAWATASPRSTDAPKSPSNIVHLVSSTERLGISVSSPSSGGGGSSSGITLWIASVDCSGQAGKTQSSAYSIMCICAGDWLLVTYMKVIKETQAFGVHGREYAT
jgi:hypothetical protein